MTVKFEIKDQLARLLAQEDLIVEHKDCETAQFNVETRVLTLPNWNRASEVVYDLLVGHEVGHALYTPNEDFSHVKAPKSYLNVTEDARIEKLMKRRFPGLAKSFFRGYTELNENDFFGIEGENVDKFSFIDRINLYFKGNLDMKFSVEEKPFVDMVSQLETFADACLAAEQIYAFTQEKKKESEDVPAPEMIQVQNEGSSGGEGSTMEVPMGEGETMDGLEDNGGEQEGPGGGISGGDTFEEGFTDENLQEKLETLCGYSYGDTIYLEVPDLNMRHLVVPPQKIWNYYEQRHAERLEGYQGSYDPDEYYVDEYNSFKKSAQKEVNYLVKEFEMKKSASAYARAATSRTGVLNTGLLHTYKFNEDLFKKVTVLPDGKNHGLIFVLDWSGSMQNVLKDTVKQLLNLVWFCRKVNIPFEVYAFSNEWFRQCEDAEDIPFSYRTLLHQEPIANTLALTGFFNMLNFLSSKTRAKDFENHCKYLYLLASNPGGYPQLMLSGTPLNEALISLYKLIPQFKERHGVEKLNAIILTDGEAQCIPYIVNYDNTYGFNSITDRCVLRDRKLGTTYNIPGRWTGPTSALLKNLQDRFPEVNLLGIRILGGGELRRYLSNQNLKYDEIEKAMTQWKKNKSATVVGVQGYAKYFAMSSSSLNNDSEFEVADNATKSQIKSAFTKSLKSKKLNKKILSEFVEVIA